MKQNKQASLLIIGNEILSGRTVDKNLNFIAVKLAQIGVDFAEVRVVRDIHSEIVEAVQQLSSKYDYLFTTGGIGPTHDDITTESVAQAFDLPVVFHKDAVAALQEYYKDRQDDLNDARLKMAQVPEGAVLIKNPLTAAPGYKINNVFVLAGIPKIMQVMFESCLQYVKVGYQVKSSTIECNLVEGDIAEKLGEIDAKYENLDIGSYPFIKDSRYAVSLVIRSTDEDKILAAEADVRELVLSLGGKIFA